VLLVFALAVLGWAGAGQAEGLAIESFSGEGRLSYGTLNDGAELKVQPD
jgi:hypothetical protein